MSGHLPATVAPQEHKSTAPREMGVSGADNAVAAAPNTVRFCCGRWASSASVVKTPRSRHVRTHASRVWDLGLRVED